MVTISKSIILYTKVNDPLTPLANDSFQFINVNGNLNTKGTETNLKLGIKISNYS
jgi:iron complex outermembrane receptor protein